MERNSNTGSRSGPEIRRAGWSTQPARPSVHLPASVDQRSPPDSCQAATHFTQLHVAPAGSLIVTLIRLKKFVMANMRMIAASCGSS
ncbi:MAG: hypothetical protein JWO42_1541 [Chloroflexi bacterium]|nr:hypothetical protein [Chloroflexota bacterium]